MKRFFVIALGALCLSGGLAQAQAQTSATPASAAPVSKATPATRALAERYFEVVHYDKMLNQMMKGMMPAMIEAMRRQTPDVTEAQGQIFSDVALEASQDMFRRMKAPMLDAMAEVFTEQELRDLIAFYQTPTGQALLAKTPELTQRMAADMPAIMGDMQAEMHAKLCARMTCAGAKDAGSKTPNS